MAKTILNKEVTNAELNFMLARLRNSMIYGNKNGASVYLAGIHVQTFESLSKMGIKFDKVHHGIKMYAPKKGTKAYAALFEGVDIKSMIAKAKEIAAATAKAAKATAKAKAAKVAKSTAAPKAKKTKAASKVETPKAEPTAKVETPKVEPTTKKAEPKAKKVAAKKTAEPKAAAKAEPKAKATKKATEKKVAAPKAKAEKKTAPKAKAEKKPTTKVETPNVEKVEVAAESK